MFTLHKKNLILSFVLRGFVVFFAEHSLLYTFFQKSQPLFSKKFNFFRKSFSLVVLPTNFFVLSQHIVVV